jgi:hypothetical protein
MNGARPSRAAQALWLMLGVTAVALLFLGASNYVSCRIDGMSKVGCFIWALLSAAFEAFLFVLVTIFKVLMLVLP